MRIPPNAPLVFIAGPYTNPDTCVNMHIALKRAQAITDMGAAVFIPHLFHFWHIMQPQLYAFWTSLDNAMLKRCDALYRIPGDSPGADAEEDLAKTLGLPVFTSMGELDNWVRKQLHSVNAISSP